MQQRIIVSFSSSPRITDENFNPFCQDFRFSIQMVEYFQMKWVIVSKY